MATYDELRGLFSENQLQNRIQVACIVAAETIRNEDPGVTNHANRLIWAKAAFENPEGISKKMLMALLAKSLPLRVRQIPRFKPRWTRRLTCSQTGASHGKQTVMVSRIRRHVDDDGAG